MAIAAHLHYQGGKILSRKKFCWETFYWKYTTQSSFRQENHCPGKGVEKYTNHQFFFDETIFWPLFKRRGNETILCTRGNSTILKMAGEMLSWNSRHNFHKMFSTPVNCFQKYTKQKCVKCMISKPAVLMVTKATFSCSKKRNWIWNNHTNNE